MCENLTVKDFGMGKLIIIKIKILKGKMRKPIFNLYLRKQGPIFLISGHKSPRKKIIKNFKDL